MSVKSLQQILFTPLLFSSSSNILDSIPEPPQLVGANFPINSHWFSSRWFVYLSFVLYIRNPEVLHRKSTEGGDPNTASKINARARHSLNPERASVDSEARGTSGRDFDSSRPSLGHLVARIVTSLAVVLLGDIRIFRFISAILCNCSNDYIYRLLTYVCAACPSGFAQIYHV